MRYATLLTRSTRVDKGDVPDFVTEYVSWGAGPRASQHLVLAGKARAILHGRYCVSTEDIAAVAHPVLRHRVLTNFNAEAAGVRSDNIISQLIDECPAAGRSTMDDAVGKRVFGPDRATG